MRVSDSEKQKWGPYLWYLIHTIAYKNNYIPNKKKYLLNFYNYIEKIIPCPKCKIHYRKYLRKNPIDNSTNFIKWSIACHNNVNKINGKKLLNENNVKTLFYIDNNLLPINHLYIYKLLKILLCHHKENDSLHLFTIFLRNLRKVFPCDTCKAKLKEYKYSKMEIYLSVIKNCNKNNFLERQKFRVK